ncbi:hypothetical protein F5882DRAFT_423976 [Hyaloscypha sp. PMI_1271]|nr:hypothetical protein F5882DRAFT_423976 [Hyaloscypha sp. PMI_1271]
MALSVIVSSSLSFMLLSTTPSRGFNHGCSRLSSAPDFFTCSHQLSCDSAEVLLPAPFVVLDSLGILRFFEGWMKFSTV